jgi:PAS domain S-box-containing protein
MVLPDLSGATLGQYRVEERLGAGEVTVVYRATDRPTERQVALKVLDPSLADRPGFLPRFVDDTAILSRLGHPGIVPVYEVATHGALTYLSMRLVRGGSLKNLLGRRALDVRSAMRIVQDVARALHSAHEAGVVHRDLKPSNVLVETNGSTLVTDFGLASIRYGCALGTPGYMSPEQAIGDEADRRADVHALGLLLFEMVTGTQPYAGESPPQLILATVNDPVPSARTRNPELPPELDEVLFRALAKDPSDRQNTVMEFLDELDEVPLGPLRHRWSDDQLLALVEASPDPVLAIDASGRITQWNSRAESTFGWSRDQIMGKPVLTSLIASRHREPFERVLAGFVAGHAPQADGQPVEVLANHLDGHQVALEVSLSHLKLPAGKTAMVAFCRDVSERKETERLLAMQDAVSDATSEVETSDGLVLKVLEAICSTLGWPAGAVWVVDEARSRLRCHGFWRTLSLAGSELEALSRSGDCSRGVGLPGRAWDAEKPVWRSDSGAAPESARDRAARRAGLCPVGAVPIRDGQEVVGVFEFFSHTAETPGAARAAEVEAVGRRMGRFLRRSASTPPGRARYKLDTRTTNLAFSCAFMKFMTVHGHFRDFSGWVEMEGDDPLTARAECRIKTASVDTDSLDRDYHLCSAEFFAVERFPEMVFRSTAIEALGDERFRLFGELTIRDVTRPIRLDVRLEDREIDSSGVERATLTALTVINRLEWFLDWEKALQIGRWIVGDEVRLDLVITLVRHPGVRKQVV